MCGAAARWNADAAMGLNDQQLAERLAFELGSYGGSAGSGMDVEYTGDALRIWGSITGFVRRTKDKPILQGSATILYARHAYASPTPANSSLLYSSGTAAETAPYIDQQILGHTPLPVALLRPYCLCHKPAIRR